MTDTDLRVLMDFQKFEQYPLLNAAIQRAKEYVSAPKEQKDIGIAELSLDELSSLSAAGVTHSIARKRVQESDSSKV